ncbi:Lipopolysaccharide biosynthesis protein, LPS:glycosyltransferase [Pseudooceanicola antarcticus]|uniref:Glycosyltransferase family 8 protein n=1 Tax=Pseudooceanicola antarcticus TaxID=1247613 RepID=A0A285HNE4_9RHOB|nr:glycosyltransferase family 8 protein [Pseudooceanicola antarcticus]PJE27760.1 glycosyltransferase family 8 protein [Pseudooceanicola antarcticus]SNY37259.1 Lipopolysaccharide biosynthesis protein, LPS:glycosyltransferase [Pseudooceanicola antarcticus]
MSDTRLKISLASDRGMIDAALVVLGTVAEHCSAPLELHFLGHGLRDEDRDRLAHACDAHGCALVLHALQDEDFGDAVQVNENIPLVAMARLLLPRRVSGRVLYLDCDMLVQGDVAELFELMPQGAALGAVRDFYVLDQMRPGSERPEKLAWHSKVLGRSEVEGYFNSGLLLLDCDVIRSDRALMTRMTDFAAANDYRYMDQDYLNVLFDGRVFYLPQAWNSIWGRDRLRAKTLAELTWLPDAERTPATSKVIHYTGPNKPWKSQSKLLALLRGRLPALMKWRRAASGRYA